MPTPLLARLERRIPGWLRTMLPTGAVVLSILTFATYAMGLVRDKMLAHTYGAGSELDAYNAAFVLPELALDVLVAGGLVAPFVPVFLGLKGEAEAAARQFGQAVFTLAVGVMTVAAVALFFLAPITADLIVPTFNPAERDLYIGLFRVMLCTPVIFAASLVVGEILVAEHRFVTFGLAGLMYSGGIAAGAFFLGAPDRLGIYGAAAGAVAGAAAHLGIRVVGIWRTRFRPRPTLAFRTKGLTEFLRLMAPKMISQPIEPLTFTYFTRLASGMAVGSVAAYSFGRNFQGMPVSFIGMSFAIAAFPALSTAAGSGDRRGFLRVFRTNLLTIALFSTLAAAGLFILGGFAIRILLGGGRFDAEDVAQTTLVTSVFALSIPIESVGQLIARALYATKNTLLPTGAAVAGFIATVLVAETLAPTVGLAAIPGAYAAGMAVRVALMGAALAIRVASIGRRAEDADAAAATVGGIRVTRSPRPAAGRPGPSLRPRPAQLALGLLAAVVLIGGLVYAGSETIRAAFSTAPVTTPWAVEKPLAVHSVPPLPTITPTASPTPLPAATDPVAIGSASPDPTPSPTPEPTATPKPGPFEMDLYQEGDFVEEAKDTWCIPAAMQTSMNIMVDGADTTKDTQTKLFNLAVSIGGSEAGGAEPEGWASGLEQLGFGRFEVGTEATLDAAVKIVVRQIRLTNRPAGLLVWYGWHSWVVSGFKATADPAVTDNYTVTALYIEDVWYDRVSSLWSQDRGGHSRPPDSLVPASALGKDYLPWKQGYKNPGKQGRYVFVIPVGPSWTP